MKERGEGLNINCLLRPAPDICFAGLPLLVFDDMEQQAHLDSLERRVGVLQRTADAHESLEARVASLERAADAHAGCCCETPVLLPFRN